MSKKCVAFSKSKLGLETSDNRKSFYAGWDAALAEQVEQEPIYISESCAERGCACHYSVEVDGEPVAVYSAPVRTKDLTDDEIDELHSLDKFWDAHADDIFRYMDFARAVIAADREKNKLDK